MAQASEANFYQKWPVADPVALLAISHGLGEHSGRYTQLAEFFNQQGFTVWAIDHRGHGQSPGQRGHIEDFSVYSDDLHVMVQALQAQHPHLPMHMLGHSMGGLIATGYCLRHEACVSRLVLSAPAYGVNGVSAKLSLALAPVLAMLAPQLDLSNGLDAAAVSRDAAVVTAYRNDPLVHDRISASWAAAFRREQRFVKREIHRLQPATLMLVAGADSLANPLTAAKWFNIIATADKKLIEYPQAYHEIFNEPEQYEALQQALAWLQQRSA
jgi:alpha-beta hydrolase superfamily lysophospholipase